LQEEDMEVEEEFIYQKSLKISLIVLIEDKKKTKKKNIHAYKRR